MRRARLKYSKIHSFNFHCLLIQNLLSILIETRYFGAVYSRERVILLSRRKCELNMHVTLTYF